MSHLDSTMQAVNKGHHKKVETVRLVCKIIRETDSAILVRLEFDPPREEFQLDQWFPLSTITEIHRRKSIGEFDAIVAARWICAKKEIV